LLFVPTGSSVLERLAELVRAAPKGEMLNDRLRHAYLRVLSDLSAVPGVRIVVDAASGEEGAVGATLLAATVPGLLADPHAMLTECFGALPQELLPGALRDRNDLRIPRRVNGHITTADVPAEA
jgi:NADP-dependent aldehyde dehydrogenase